MIRVDLHVHTHYSPDSLAPLPAVVHWAERRGLAAMAITDHDTIAGALALRRWSAVRIIVGEEIRTTHGEIVGLFLEEPIPPGLSPARTVRRIREQNGIVSIPHPMDRVRGSAIDPAALQEIRDEVDLVEVLNARVTFPADNRLAEAWADWHGLIHCAGSDAHHPVEIGRAWVEMPDFSDRDSFLAALRKGRIRGAVSSPVMHLSSTYARVTKGIREEFLATR